MKAKEEMGSYIYNSVQGKEWYDMQKRDIVYSWMMEKEVGMGSIQKNECFSTRLNNLQKI